MIKTSCEHCVFKVVENGKQTGCQLGRIKQFKKQGAEIESVDNHLVIKNRFCLALRTSTWAKKQNHPTKKVREEIRIQCDFIIYVDKTNNLQDVETTIVSLVKQDLLPLTVRVVINTDNILPNNVLALLDETLPDGIEYFVDLVKIKDQYGKRHIRNRCLDVAADKCDNTYYAVFNAGYKIPPTFLADIDRSLNDNLERFCALEPNEDGNGLLIQTKLHKLLLGNRPMKLKEYPDGELTGDEVIDKAKFVSEEQNQGYMIKKVTQICPTM